MGWRYTGLEFDYCVRIQRLYVKPIFGCRSQGALLRQLKSRYPKAPIFAHLIRVDKDVSLNVVMDFSISTVLKLNKWSVWKQKAIITLT